MIDRKIGDKPISFEVSVGKCVKLFSKAEWRSWLQVDTMCYWQLCLRVQASLSEQGLQVCIKVWSSFPWVASCLFQSLSCLYSQVLCINTNLLTQYTATHPVFSLQISWEIQLKKFISAWCSFCSARCNLSLAVMEPLCREDLCGPSWPTLLTYMWVCECGTGVIISPSLKMNAPARPVKSSQ